MVPISASLATLLDPKHASMKIELKKDKQKEKQLESLKIQHGSNMTSTKCELKV